MGIVPGVRRRFEAGRRCTPGWFCLAGPESSPVLSFYGRCGVGTLATFIDGAYLDYLCRDHFQRLRIDYGRFAEEIWRTVAQGTRDSLDLLRTYYYHCPPYQSNPPSDEERSKTEAHSKFRKALESLPRFEYRAARLASRGLDREGRQVFEQKRVDLLLGLDIALLSAKGRITHVALIAGDSDFIAALDVAKQEGVSTWLFHGPVQTCHAELRRAADERREIDAEFISRCVIAR
ncbi:MAG: NYN domain-containing protein [Chloroflexi bacterium]|nr:NYN domain-containing protein [Chloroflexota bacterium]